MIQVGELERVADEEHRRVVSNQIPISFFGIELYGKAPDVSLGISSPTFTCHGRETYEYLRLFSYFGEKFCTSVIGYVVRYGEVSVCTASFGMHAPFGDDFTVEVRKLLNEPSIF